MQLNDLVNKIQNINKRKVEFKIEYPTIENSSFGALNASDISSHLSLLYFLVHLRKPKVILELGTRDGQSTRALRLAASELGIKGISVDLSPAPDSTFDRTANWSHVQEDDIQFAAKLRNLKYRKELLGADTIDFLFLDTSHEYLHTKAEIEAYWPLISVGGLLILHDTNLSETMKIDVDGRTYNGWNNARGVSRAVEEFFEFELREQSLYTRKMEEITLLNLPWGNGLLILLKDN